MQEGWLLFANSLCLKHALFRGYGGMLLQELFLNQLPEIKFVLIQNCAKIQLAAIFEALLE